MDIRINLMSKFCNYQRSKRLYYAVRPLNGITHTVQCPLRSDVIQCSIRHEREKLSLYLF